MRSMAPTCRRILRGVSAARASRPGALGKGEAARGLDLVDHVIDHPIAYVMQVPGQLATGPDRFIGRGQVVTGHQPLAIEADHADAQVLCRPICISGKTGGLRLRAHPYLVRDPGDGPAYANGDHPRARGEQLGAAGPAVREELRVHLLADGALLVKDDLFDAAHESAGDRPPWNTPLRPATGARSAETGALRLLLLLGSSIRAAEIHNRQFVQKDGQDSGGAVVSVHHSRVIGPKCPQQENTRPMRPVGTPATSTGVSDGRFQSESRSSGHTAARPRLNSNPPSGPG